MVYSLTHRIDEGEGVEHKTVVGTATKEQMMVAVDKLGDMAYQYYVTEWDTNDSPDEDDWDILESENADEWLEWMAR